jgi:aspartate kinase
MKVFKFGGASVKDAESVKNVARVLNKVGYKNTLVVISAMGKMTNAFEQVINAYFNNSEDLNSHIDFVRTFHYNIVNQLFKNSKNIEFEIELIFGKLSMFLAKNRSKDYNYIYDQVIGFGELLSTKIISYYLNEIGLENKWLDVRDYIKTDANYRDAKVDWNQSKKLISEIDTKKLSITQGFLGSNSKNKTTSLGREGSDFTAAIFAYCLNAESVTIWKDVDGVLNADPRYFKHTQLLEEISYREAIEMAFYGASVIHPKTLKPLENKEIPLRVRSFFNMENQGTVVSKGTVLKPKIPCFILKQQQMLVSISAKDFSFMVEHNLSDIFKILSTHKLKVNLIQNSAISFSVCIEDKYNLFEQFLNEIKKKYSVTIHKNVSLYTIRHADENAIKKIETIGKVLLKQSTKGTVQVVMN